MNNEIRIKTSDGKYLTGTIDNYAGLVNELKTYEADLKLKKEKDEAERKRRAEVEASVKQYRDSKLKEINEYLEKVIEKIRAYEEETGYKIIYSYDYSNGNTVAKDTPNNSIDLAWYSFADDFFNKLNNKK